MENLVDNSVAVIESELKLNDITQNNKINIIWISISLKSMMLVYNFFNSKKILHSPLLVVLIPWILSDYIYINTT